MAEMTTEDARQWLAAFERKNGRKLRVLHIGNIANNAYNNAKIQRQYGIEADVICYDYYHIMSCPEWEDSTFTGEVGGNFPDWFATSLKGWSRPEWFVQGPADLCLQYLRARHLNMAWTKRLLQRYLEVNYWRILDDFAAVEGRKRPPAPWHMRWVAWLVETMGLHHTTINETAELGKVEAFDAAGGRMRALYRKLRDKAKAPASSQALAELLKWGQAKSRECGNVNLHNILSIKDILRRITAKISVLVRRPCVLPKQIALTIFKLLVALIRGSLHIITNTLVELARLARLLSKHLALLIFKPLIALIKGSLRIITSTFAALARLAMLLPEHLALLIFKPLIVLISASLRIITSTILGLAHVARVLSKHLAMFVFKSPFDLKHWWGKQLRIFLERRGDAAKARFAKMGSAQERAARIPAYHDRRSQLIGAALHADATVQDQVKTYTEYMPLRFFDVLKTYDVIQGYSIDGFIPYMNGLTNFAAYEHGTIRDLPWEPSLSGIVAAKVYREAPLVFVTNSDVLPSVDRLGLDPDRVVYLPHAFDDAKLRVFRDTHPQLQPPASGPPVFFSPTRHHWQDKSGSWTKGNDIMLRAAGELLNEGYNFRLVLVEWGNEVSNSKELIDTLGLTDKVTWVPTMQKRELWTQYCSSHAVIDQFTLPALGGVGFETMALGRRLITALDEAQMTRFFGCPPPCLTAQTVAQCRERMREVILDPGDQAGRGNAARQWMIDYHSAQRIVSLQANAYNRLLASASDTPLAQPC